MKAIITIGYVNLLVRDTKTATKLIELLSGAVEVSDHLYEGELVMRSSELRLEMKVVPATARILPAREPEGVSPAHSAAEPKRLNGRRQLLLRQ